MARYTALADVDQLEVAKRYELDDLRLVLLPGGAANSSFRLSAKSGEFVLTILDNHDLISAERLAVHTQAMFQCGVPTSEVVPTIDGRLVAAHQDRPMVLKKWIDGYVHQPLPQSMLAAAGRILALVHALPTAAEQFATVPRRTRRLSPTQLAAVSDFPDQEFAAWLTERLAVVRQSEVDRRRPDRIIHGDLFDDNLIVRKDGRISVIDWETVSFDDPLIDLGMAAVGLAREADVLVPERLAALLAGYQEISPLNEADAGALRAEIVHAALIIAFHRYYRHNIRFPDPEKRRIHVKMIDFVDSVEIGPAY